MQIFFDKEQVEILSQLTGLNFEKPNPKNQKTIDSLLVQGKINAENYLSRKKLGQKLDILEENNLFNTLVELKEKLNLVKIPRRIECFDISHLSGHFVYGSMVVFIDGIAKNSLYRVFKCPNGNDDFINHKLVLFRRINKFFELENAKKLLLEELKVLEKNDFDNAKTQTRKVEIEKLQKKIEQNKTHLQSWKLPDLIIVDGGKGQLSADFKVLCQFGLESMIEIVALAKREEEIFTINDLEKSELNTDNDLKIKTENWQDEKEKSSLQNSNLIHNLTKENLQNSGQNLGQKLGQNLEDGISQNFNQILKEDLNQEKLNSTFGKNEQEDIKEIKRKGFKSENKTGSQGGILLTNSTKYLVQRIRDEAHRFAIKHNRNARIRDIKNSQIDTIIGPKTKLKLLTKFGSLSNLSTNLEQNLELVIETVGLKNAQKLQKYFSV